MNTSILEHITDEAVPISDKINRLKKGRNKPLPDIHKYRKEWEVSEHRTMTDLTYLPYRWVSESTGRKDAKGKDILRSKYVDVNRLAFPFQKKIVRSKVAFSLGNPVKLLCETKDKQELSVLEALKRIGHDCKLKSFQRRQLRECSRSTEVAEIWYAVPYNKNQKTEKHNTYGFDTTLKLRVTGLAPWDGNVLYPYFDETGDMVAFSREFRRKNDKDKEDIYYEVYTDTNHIVWVQENGVGEWTEKTNEENMIGKIPVNFMSQEAVEWADLQYAIERLELLLSRFAEINDYHSAPKIFVEGEIKSFAQKGESGAIIQGSAGAKAYYLSWQHAPEAVKLEIETLLRFIYGFTQTPDISFDSVKGLSAISGIALELLFMDAHLKVQELRESLDDYLQRQINLQKAFIAFMKPDFAKATQTIQVEPEVVPYMINDQTTMINNLVTATGGKAILSRKQAVKMAGFVDDVEAELAELDKEEQSNMVADAFEPTI